MSSVIAGTVSKPSRAHNLAYIIFGYTIAFSSISQSHFDNLSDYLILVAIIGGFIGTFLFFIKPIDKLLHLYSRAWTRLSLNLNVNFSWLFSSPYLAETRGKIIGGLYFFLTCLTIGFFNVNLENISGANVSLVRWFLTAIGSVVMVISFWEIHGITEKFDTLNFYYASVGDVGAQRIPETSVQHIREALNRGDWTEARLLIIREKERMERGAVFV